MLGPFATASRRTPPVLHCHSPGVCMSHAATVARRLRIDVHNNINDNNDNNDNA